MSKWEHNPNHAQFWVTSWWGLQIQFGGTVLPPRVHCFHFIGLSSAFGNQVPMQNESTIVDSATITSSILQSDSLNIYPSTYRKMTMQCHLCIDEISHGLYRIFKLIIENIDHFWHFSLKFSFIKNLHKEPHLHLPNSAITMMCVHHTLPQIPIKVNIFPHLNPKSTPPSNLLPPYA